MTCLVRGGLWGLESDARLARIGVHPEDQELGCERAEIDSSTDQRLALVGRLRQYDLALDPWSHGVRGRDKLKINRLVDFVHHRLKRDHTGLPHSRANSAADAQPVSPAAREIKRGKRPLHGIDTGRLRERSARRLARLEFHVLASLADFIEPNDRTPEMLRNRHHHHSAAAASATAGAGKRSTPRANSLSGCASNASTTCRT